MGDFALKRQALWCEIRFFLILVVAAAMLTGCAAGESNSLFTEGLAYSHILMGEPYANLNKKTN